MNTAKLIVNYVLYALDNLNVLELQHTMGICKRLLEEMPAYSVGDVLEIILKEENNA